MKNFEYARAYSETEAVELLTSAQRMTTAVLAGGTDLVGLMKRMIVTPDRVVDISQIESMRFIEPDPAGGVWVGAAVHLDEFLASRDTDLYPAVKQVIQGINSIQLQAQGTIGGELLRRPMCWYFRAGHGLLAERGDRVVQGDNRYHAILGNRGPAKFVSASRLAPALISLEAEVRVVGPKPDDERIVPLEDLYQIPKQDGQIEITLEPGQILTHIFLPPDRGRLSAAYEVRHGEGPDPPLAAAAATIEASANIVQAARVVLGQVAPIPWIADQAAQSLIGQPINETTARIAGHEAIVGAQALSHNAYKIQLAQTAAQRAILRAAGLPTGGF